MRMVEISDLNGSVVSMSLCYLPLSFTVFFFSLLKAQILPPKPRNTVQDNGTLIMKKEAWKIVMPNQIC